MGSYYLKLVEMRTKGRGTYEVSAVHKVHTPENSISKTKITNEAALITAVRQLIVGAGVKPGRVVLGLNSPDIIIRSAPFPRMPRKELDKVLEFELGEVFKLSPEQSLDDLFVSYDVVTETENESTVLGIGCPKGLMRPYLNVMRKAGLTPVAVDIGAFALPRVDSPHQNNCYVDLGHTQTVVYIELDGIYKVYRILPFGGYQITQGIMEAFQTQEPHAEYLKSNYDIDYLMTEGSGSKINLRGVMQQYVQGILQTLDYLRVQARRSSVRDILDKVVLCGGNAHIQGAAPMLEQEIRMDVTVLDPFSQFPGGVLPSGVHSIYSAALGLARRGLEK